MYSAAHLRPANNIEGFLRNRLNVEFFSYARAKMFKMFKCTNKYIPPTLPERERVL